MVFALGAVSSALDALKSLTSSTSSSSQTNGSSPASANPFDLSANATAPSANPTPASGSNGGSQIAPSTLSALFAAQSQSSSATATPASASPSNALRDLFQQLDANGDGQISKSEFENALGAGGTNLANADKVFGELDKNGDGSVGIGELSSALEGGKGHHHHGHVGGSDGAGSSADPLLQALQGASSSSVTNSDGSTTTSLTYADGSKVTLTSPAAATASSNATSSYNIVEQLIQREAQGLSSSVSASLSISV
jgi:Ca2+-binding EF-hand superfamily protein